ncbi:unnamed protein product [Spirodela intermedia]|uniref:Uncharacterized protein n=1 Tax=Spirodela intermedia TaxID=51605 RepID=A0A7I8LC67_SPIIN|nr:unnamed protein product [Spirodela intermedia]
MDVLFGSIDVRELLPAAGRSLRNEDGEEDHATTPLSAPDLRLVIDRLQVRSLQIKDRVREYVLANRAEFSAIFSCCADVASCSDAVSEVLSSAVRTLSGGDDDCPVDVRIRDIANELTDKRRELEERKSALVLVQAIAVLRDRLESVRMDSQAWRFVHAAGTLRDLKGALLIPDGAVEDQMETDEEPVVHGLLRREWYLCLDELQGVLARLVESAIRFEPESGLVEVSQGLKGSNAEYVEFQRVLEAMDMINSLDYGLAKVADLMIKNLVTPIICDRFKTPHIEELSWDSDEKAVAILQLLPPPEPQESVDAHPIYSRLLQVIKFIHKYVLFQDAKWTLCFSRLTWSRISELVITFFLSKVVPDDASKIAEFQEIIRYTAEFEASLQKIGFISENDNEGKKLSLFATNIEVHFASQKKKEILASARSLLLQCDFSFPSASGVSNNEYIVNLLFEAEACFISKAAFHLMELVHQILKNVCMSSTKVAMEFYHAARDALLLYKAIVPVKLEKQLGTISQAAVVIHNDCLYLSQEISGLSFEYRENFPNGVKECALFVDIAPNFRQMAEDALWKQVQLVYFSLKEAVDGANGFQNTHQIQLYDSAKFSLDQVVFILEKVHIIWEPILPKSTYRRTMCILLDFVFKAVMKDVLLLDDIAAEETLQLQRLIYLLLENLSSLFESLVDTSAIETFSSDSRWPYLNEKVPSLGKFRKLADLLDMTLKSITWEWENGDLARCGFTSSEVGSLIRGIFTESPLRKECLGRIEGNHL